MDHKTIPTYTKMIDEDQGIVETIFAVFGNVDEGLDVLHPGSFKKTIRERGSKVRVLDQHNTDSIIRVLGKLLEIREIGLNELPPQLRKDFPDANGGVYARIQFFMETPEGKGAFIRLREGGIDEWSFGYDPVDTDFSSQRQNGDKVRLRNIRQLKLYEISPVLWGMNQATVTVGAKQKDEGEGGRESKGVLKFLDLDLGDRKRAWDEDAAEARVREWAGGKDDMDWDKYAQAFLWRNDERSEQFDGFKLGYADIIGGELMAMPRGIFAAAGALQGARTPPDIPEADIQKAKAHAGRYYDKMRAEFDDPDIIAPWEKSRTVTFTFVNVLEAIDLDAAEAAMKKILVEAGRFIEHKGPKLARLLNEELEKSVSDDNPRSEIVKAVAEANDMTTGGVNQVLRGDVKCPPEKCLAGFSQVLGVSMTRLQRATAEDGCQKAGAGAEETKGHQIAQTMGDVLQGNLHFTFTNLVDKWYILGLMTRDERLLLSSLIGDALDVLNDGMPEELAGRDLSQATYFSGPDMCYGLELDLDAKAGRVLSTQNAAKIQAAMAHLHEVLMGAGLLEIEESGSHLDGEEDEEKVNQQRVVSGEAGPGQVASPTMIEAGPNGSSPTSDEDLLRLINIEEEMLDIIQHR